MRTFVRSLVLLTVLAGSIEAQGVVRPRANRQARRLEQQVPPGAPAARQQQLQQQVRRMFWRAAKNRIGFTDAQMTQLEETSRRFDLRRRALAQEERKERVALRQQVQASGSADQSAISASMERLLQLQRQRVDLQADEMKELSAFTTPIQRAKFFALQEQVRRRVQELVRARGDSSAQSAMPEVP